MSFETYGSKFLLIYHLHTVVLRWIIYCDGHLNDLYPHTNPYTVQCKTCGYRYRGWPGQELHQIRSYQRRHRRTEPDYFEDITAIRAALEEIAKRPQKDGLLYHLLKEMGVRDEHLPLKTSAVESLFQMEMISSSSEQIIKKIVDAYSAMVLSDRKGLTDVQKETLDRLENFRRPDGVPLFARLGGGKSEYDEDWDLPYVLMHTQPSYPEHKHMSVIFRSFKPGEWALRYNSILPEDVCDMRYLLQAHVDSRVEVVNIGGIPYWAFDITV